MDPMLTLSFLGAAIVLTLMPGPDNLFVIAQSISQEKNAGIAVSFGLCSGLIVHVTAASLGISAIVYQSSLAFNLVKYAGAIYLLYLSWQAFRNTSADLTMRTQKSTNYKSLYKKGILMNLLNPKVSLFFLALLPQFIDKSLGHVSLQMFVLGMVFLVQALVIFTGISVFSEKVRSLLVQKPSLSRKISLVQGMVFLLISLKLLISEK